MVVSLVAPLVASLLLVSFSLFVDDCLLFVVCGLWCAVCCLVFVVVRCSLLFGFMLFVVSCVLFIVCGLCVLFATCL